MPTKNYVYGCHRPAAGLDVIEGQFRLMHDYRNRLVERERERRKEAEAVVRRMVPAYTADEGEALAASQQAELAATRVREANQAASAAAGRATIGATKEQKAEAVASKKAASEAWAKFKATKKAAYADPGVRAELAAVDAADLASRKRLRAESGLYWGNYCLVEQAAGDFRSGGPPEFASWHRTDRHQVGVQVQGGMSVGELFSPNTRVWAEDGARPAGETAGSGRSRRRYLKLHLRAGSDDRGKPVWAEVRVVMHRPLPDDGRVKWVRLLRRRVGTQERWQVAFSVDTPTRGLPDAAHAGVVGIAFKSRQCEGGVEVATWCGSDGATGRVVLPEADLGRWDEGRRVRSAVDVMTGVLRDALGEWAGGRAVTLAVRPFEAGGSGERRVAGFEGELPAAFRSQAGKRDEVPTAAEAAARLKQWRSPDRFLRLLGWWKSNRFAGDDEGFALLSEWAYRYRHLEDWRGHAAEQHAAWRLDLFRRAVAGLRRRYRKAVIAEAMSGEAIVKRPQLKAEGDEWTPPPDNDLRRTASCGLLRRVLAEGFAEPLKVKPEPGWGAAEVLAAVDRAIPCVKASAPRFKPRTKQESTGDEAAR